MGFSPVFLPAGGGGLVLMVGRCELTKKSATDDVRCRVGDGPVRVETLTPRPRYVESMMRQRKRPMALHNCQNLATPALKMLRNRFQTRPPVRAATLPPAPSSARSSASAEPEPEAT